MSSNVVVCQVDPELQSQLTSFRSRKEKVASALVMKVDKETQTVVLDELLEDLESLEELRDSLPDHQPRFIVYTCCLSHSDGRSSFPMCFIFFSPRDCKPEMQMMYAGSKLELVNKVILSHLYPCAMCPSNHPAHVQVNLQHVFEVRELEEITEEWLHAKLGKN